MNNRLYGFLQIVLVSFANIDICLVNVVTIPQRKVSVSHHVVKTINCSLRYFSGIK